VLVCAQIIGNVRQRLLPPSDDDAAPSLTLQQFLYFVGVALDLPDKGEEDQHYTPLLSFISHKNHTT
jgi:hypothetical protein